MTTKRRGPPATLTTVRARVGVAATWGVHGAGGCCDVGWLLLTAA
ncbi:hypothetical protein V6Z11_D05G407800 [Gossypium hirsutum]